MKYLYLGFQSLPLLSWNSIPGLWTKNPEMGHIWIVPTPSFERSNTIKLLMWNPILDIGYTFYSFKPKLWWKILSLHHISCHLLQWSVLSLEYTILLWCVRNIMLNLDTYIFTILDEIRLDILTTIFRSKDLDFPPRLVLNQGSKDVEEVQNFRLVL